MAALLGHRQAQLFPLFVLLNGQSAILELRRTLVVA